MKASLPTSAMLSVCDDLRQRAPKQTALIVRYLITVIDKPGLKPERYHAEVTGNAQYAHGSTLLKSLHDLGYISLSQPLTPNDSEILLTPKTLTLFKVGTGVCQEQSSRVDVSRLTDRLRVKTPYHPAVPAKATDLGGQWKGEYWEYSLGNEPAVRSMYLEIFGEYGQPGNRVDMNCQGRLEALCDEGSTPKTLFIAGLKIASVTRQNRLWLASYVSVSQGTLQICGKEGCLQWDANTELTIQGVPEDLAKSLVRTYPENVKSHTS